jgi:hypothetical protein
LPFYSNATEVTENSQENKRGKVNAQMIKRPNGYFPKTAKELEPCEAVRVGYDLVQVASPSQ